MSNLVFTCWFPRVVVDLSSFSLGGSKQEEEAEIERRDVDRSILVANSLQIYHGHVVSSSHCTAPYTDFGASPDMFLSGVCSLQLKDFHLSISFLALLA